MSGRIWPITAMLVIVALLLMLYDGFVAVFSAAAFFGETSTRRALIKAAMTCFTAMPAFAAMIWCGWQRGSRLGLLLIGPPAALMVYLGLSLLASTSGSSRDHNPDRAASLEDIFGGLTRLNWAAALAFAGVAVVTHVMRQQARHTELGSAA